MLLALVTLATLTTQSVALDERGEIWRLDPSGDRVTVIDAKTAKPGRSVDVGFTPSAIAAGAGRVYVLGGGNVVAIDAAGGKVGPKVRLTGATDLVMNGGRLFAILSAALAELDPSTLKKKKTLPVPGGRSVHLLPGAGDVFVTASRREWAIHTLEPAPRLLTTGTGPPPQWIDPAGQIGVRVRALKEATEGGPWRSELFSLQSGKRLALFPPGHWGFHPDFPYAALAADDRRIGLVDLYTYELEIVHPKGSLPVGGKSPVSPATLDVHLLPKSGVTCLVPPAPAYANPIALPLEKLKHNEPRVAFTTLPPTAAPVGRPFRYVPKTNRKARVGLARSPEGAAFSGGAFTWKPKLEDIGRSVGVTFTADAGKAQAIQKVEFFVGARSVRIGRSPRFRHSTDGKWLYAVESGRPPVLVSVDLMKGRVHRVKLEGTSTPNPMAIGDASGTVYVGTSGSEILRVSLRSHRAQSPIKTNYKNCSSILTATKGKTILVQCQNPKTFAQAVYLLSGRRLTPIEGFTTLTEAAITPDGKTILWGAMVFRIKGSKAVQEPAPVAPRPPVFSPELPPIPVPLVQVSGDGKVFAFGAKLYASDLKTEIENSPPAPTVLDRTRGRYLRMEKDGSLTVWTLGRKKVSHRVGLGFIPLPGGKRDRPTGLFLSSTPNAIILTTRTGVVIVDLP